MLVPPGYTSGDPLSGTATWPGTTFAGLGLTPGIYTWTWGSGADADSFVVDIGVPLVTPIPEPSTLLVAGMALGVVGCGAWMRRWRAAAVAA